MFVRHNRAHVAIIKAKENAIIWNRIRFAQEIRSPKDINLPRAKANRLN